MNQKHWTEASPKDFQFRIAFDFVEQVQEVLELQGINQKQFADKLEITEGRVSQILNNPGNLTLRSIVRWSRAIGHKVGVVLYSDNDSNNERGPIDSDVFKLCWKHLGMPSNHGELCDILEQKTSDNVAQSGWRVNNIIDFPEWMPVDCPVGDTLDEVCSF